MYISIPFAYDIFIYIYIGVLIRIMTKKEKCFTDDMDDDDDDDDYETSYSLYKHFTKLLQLLPRRMNAVDCGWRNNSYKYILSISSYN